MVRATDFSTYSREEPWAGHSSRHIMTSEPRLSCTSTDLAGEKKCSLPSRWERKVTPSRDIFLVFERLRIWNPPLSVAIAPSQAM